MMAKLHLFWFYLKQIPVLLRKFIDQFRGSGKDED